MTTRRTNTIGETISAHDEHEDCPRPAPVTTSDADLIALADECGASTISTNMAGETLVKFRIGELREFMARAALPIDFKQATDQGGWQPIATAIDALEILNRRPRPVCRDCADENGTCPGSGLPCDMLAVIRNARFALAAPTAAVGASAHKSSTALAQACDLLSMSIGTLMSAKQKIGYVDRSPIARLIAEAVEFLRPWPEQMPATAPTLQGVADGDAVGGESGGAE